MVEELKGQDQERQIKIVEQEMIIKELSKNV